MNPNDMMSMFNPEMMQNLLNNDEIKKMMNDPNIMNNIQNMMGGAGAGGLGGLFNQKSNDGADGECADGECADGECADGECVDGECVDGDEIGEEIKIDDLEDIDIENKHKLDVGDKVITHSLKNEDFNDKIGIIEDYILSLDRFIVVFEDGKMAALKEDNLKDRFDNIENID